MKIDRAAIYERDGGLCGICGESVEFTAMELDHIQPLMLGGSDALDNLRVAHKLCNRRRGHADARAHGFVAYHPSPHQRYAVLTLDADLGSILGQLSKRLGMKPTASVRLAIREAAQRRRIGVYNPAPDGGG